MLNSFEKLFSVSLNINSLKRWCCLDCDVHSVVAIPTAFGSLWSFIRCWERLPYTALGPRMVTYTGKLLVSPVKLNICVIAESLCTHYSDINKHTIIDSKHSHPHKQNRKPFLLYKFMAKVGLTQDKSRNKQPLQDLNKQVLFLKMKWPIHAVRKETLPSGR